LHRFDATGNQKTDYLKLGSKVVAEITRSGSTDTLRTTWFSRVCAESLKLIITFYSKRQEWEYLLLWCERFAMIGVGKNLVVPASPIAEQILLT
jgi:hypothetical protein